MPNRRKKIFALISVISTSFFLGCDRSQISQAADFNRPNEKMKIQDDGPCPDGIAAFTKNVYTPILRQSCVACHDANEDGPPHSTSDMAASYKMIKSYVDFSQISKSRIIARVKSKHWLNYDAKATGTSVQIMSDAIQSWWDQGEKSCPNAATPQSSTTLIPVNLPAYPDDQFMTITWALDSLGKSFVGSSFSVDVQLFAAATKTTAGAYRLQKPRFMTSHAGVKIGGVQIYINQKYQGTSNAWGNLNAEIAGYQKFAPLLSPRNVILLQDQPTGDTLSVAFTGLQFTPNAPICKSLGVFQSKILPVIKQNSCVLCHSASATSGLGGGEYLNFENADDVNCAQVREHVDFAHPEASVFMTLGFTEALNHPPAIQLPAQFTQDWVKWVLSESAP